MEGLFTGLVLLILLAIVAAVGHGLWLAAASIIRALFSTDEEKSAERKPEVAESKLRRLWRLRGEVSELREQGVIDAAAATRILAEFEQAMSAMQPRPIPPPTAVSLQPEPSKESNPLRVVPKSTPPPLPKQAPEPVPAPLLPPAPAKESAPIPPAPPSKPARETPAEILARFMESRHIRWGELLGGLLILFCSAAWVITAWEQITRVPLLQFSVFLGATAVIFGAGLFVHRRWKLPLTARGLLVTGMLLVPLNCLAIAATAAGREGFHAAFPIYELLAIGIFALLLWLGAKVLAPESPWALALGVLIPGAISLAAGYLGWMLGNPTVTPLLAAFQVLPAAVIGVWQGYRERGKAFAPDTAELQLTQLAILWLAALPGLWLLTRHGASPSQPFAPTISLLGIAPICRGLPVWTGAAKKEHVWWQVTGAALTIFGAALYFWALGTAAPAPGWICVVGLLASIGILLLVRGGKMELARLLLSPMAAAAFIALVLGLAGEVPWENADWPILISALLGSASAAVAWMVLAFAALAVAAKFPGNATAVRLGTSIWIFLYAAAAILAAAASGVELSDVGKTGMLAIIAAAGGIYFRQAALTRRPFFDAAVACVALIFSACVFGWFGPKTDDIATALAVVLAGTGSLLMVPLALRRKEDRTTNLICVLLAGIACIPFLLCARHPSSDWWYAGMLLWVAANCIAAALVAGSPIVLAVGQSVLCAAFVNGAGQIPWLAGGSSVSSENATLLKVIFGLALASLVLFGAKMMPLFPRYRSLNAQRPFPPERWAAIAATALFCLLGTLVCVGDLGLVRTSFGNVELPRAILLAGLLILLTLLDRKVEGKSWAALRACAAFWFLSPIVAAHFEAGSYLDRFQWTLALFHLAAFLLIWAPAFSGQTLRPDVRAATAWLNSTVYSICIPAMTATAFVYWFGPESNDVRSGFQAFAPFVLMAGVQFVHGLLQQQNAPLLFSALMMHFGLTSYLIAGSRPNAEPPALLLAYWNTAVCGVFTLLWCALPFLTRPRFKTNSSKTRRSYLYSGLAVLLVAGTVGVIWIFLEPWDIDPEFAYAASPAGWLAVAFICIAWLAVDWMEGVKSKLSRFGIPAFVAVEHVGAHYQARIGWDGLSALAIGFAVAMFVPLGAGLAGRRFPGVMDERFGLQNLAISVRNWMRAFAILCVVCCVRIWFSSDAEKLPMSIALGVAAVAFMGLAFQQGSIRFLVSAGILLNTSITLWWVNGGMQWLGIEYNTATIDLLLVNLALLIFPGICSQILERRLAGDARLHPLTGYIAAAGLLLIAVSTYITQSDRVPFTPWIASIALVGTAACSTWSAFRGAFRLEAMRALQILGLATAGFAALSIEPSGGWRDLVAILLLTLFAAGVASLTKRVANALEDPADLKDIANWTRGILLLAGIATLLLSFRSVLYFRAADSNVELWVAIVLRGLAGFAPLAYAISNRIVGGRNRISEVFCFAALILASWAPIEPGGANDLLLNRMVTAMAAVSAAAWLACAFSLLRSISETVRQRALMLSSYLRYGAAIGVIVLLAAEYAAWNYRGVAISNWAIALAAAAITINMAFALVCVLYPRSNPAPLEPGQMHFYVYASEALLVALIMHLRACAPWLFEGFLERYWPLLIMTVAFVGAGMGEWFERRKLTHLSVPIGRTAIFLPLVPAIAFWARSYETDYSMLMFIAGVFYASLSFIRSSFVYAFAAGVACNIALWYFLGRTGGLEFSRHPQLWVIPFAGSILAALYSQRRHLPDAGFRTGRLFCVAAIYLSSTIELFIHGVGHSFWLPLALGALSIIGALVGMGFRVQSFLYLGSFFLLIDLVAIVWHAAANLGWTWLWYVAGIAAGLALIAAFGLMEKRGAEFKQMLGRLKSWD